MSCPITCKKFFWTYYPSGELLCGELKKRPAGIWSFFSIFSRTRNLIVLFVIYYCKFSIGPDKDPDEAMRGVDEEHKSSSSEESDPEPEEKPEEVKESEDEASDEDIEAAAARSALFGPVPAAKSSSRSNTPTEELKVTFIGHFCRSTQKF